MQDFDINDNNNLSYAENKQKKKKNRNLFTTTLFVDYYEKARYPFIHIKYKEDEKNYQMIYSFSYIDYNFLLYINKFKFYFYIEKILIN